MIKCDPPRAGYPVSADEEIALIRDIVEWRKTNDTRASYLSARRLLLRLKRERKATMRQAMRRIG